MCVSAAVKAKIFTFYYGAEHEPSMDPNISVRELAKYCKEELHIEGEIRSKECEEQIKRGRSTR